VWSNPRTWKSKWKLYLIVNKYHIMYVPGDKLNCNYGISNMAIPLVYRCGRWKRWCGCRGCWTPRHWWPACSRLPLLEVDENSCSVMWSMATCLSLPVAGAVLWLVPDLGYLNNPTLVRSVPFLFYIMNLLCVCRCVCVLQCVIRTCYASMPCFIVMVY
jgi:hypothetical protein